MKIHLIAVGTKMPAWVNAGFAEYQKRLPESCALNLIELPMEKRSSAVSVAKLKQKEGELILKALPRRAFVVVLDEHGREFSSTQLAEEFERWRGMGTDTALVVGGPDGLSADVMARADLTWSLTRLTLPHPLVRVVLAETLYRAYSIAQHLPYHRA